MKLLLALLLTLCANAHAATIYISACGTGADGACVAGSDSNDGLSAASPKLTIPALAASNTYRFARGGALARTSSISIYLPTSTKASPTIFEDYTPSWCSGACLSTKPVIYTTSSVELFYFTDSANADRDEGYIVRNLDLRGPGYDLTPPGTGFGTNNSVGISVYNDADYITVDNVSINGFVIGVYVGASNTPNSGANANSEYFTLKNSSIVNNESQGFLGGGSYSLIENNTFDWNGFSEAVFDHNIYISTTTTNPKARGIIIRGNTLTNNANIGGECSSVSLVAHASSPDMVIENNTITETASVGGCYGIDINTSTGSTPPLDHSRLIVRGNKIVLTGSAGVGIGCSACPNALIENNIVIRLGGTGFFKGITVPTFTRSGSFGDAVDTAVTVRNNSIYIDAADASSEGIELASSTGDTITNNVIRMTTNVSTSARCFSFGTRAIGTFVAHDYNTCYRPSADATWSDQHSTLATAQAAGFDTNSFKTDPGLTTPSASTYLLEASSGSAAIINAGSATYKARLGYRGKPANGARDIGACEYRTGDACSTSTPSVPSSATGLR